MLNINFVPDDYIQNNESRRTNIMYLILFALVMAGLAGAFVVIKIQQHNVASQIKVVNNRMIRAQDTINKFEQIEKEKNEMMKTALTTMGLLEPVHRSIILASLTNNLPAGTSLLKLEVNQDEPRIIRSQQPKQSKYQQANQSQEEISPEQLLETNISIEGMAQNDLQVAAYIQNLVGSPLFENVALVESKEEKSRDEIKFRRFKLSARLKKEAHITSSDIEYIRARCKKLTDNI
ncbi:MAG: PilN domain-containing protein [Phycisphaerae bacterium]